MLHGHDVPSVSLPLSLLPPYHSAPDLLHLPPQGGLQAAGLVVHKQAFHTTAKCVGVVSLVKPSQTCRVVAIFISDVQNESTATPFKLLALISIGRRRWAGTGGWGHLAMKYVCGLWKLRGLFCCFVSVLLPLFGSEARMY